MTRLIHHTPVYEDNDGKGNFPLSYHLEMISDYERVSLFKQGIDQSVTKDTVFCELGCGTGIFSIYAASKAKKVYAVEHDSKIFEIAKKNISASGLKDKIQLIRGDCLEVELPEKVDVLFSEMLSIWMIEEPQILVMNHAVNQLLKPGAVTIPSKIINLAELCHTDFTFDGIRLPTSIAQFTGIKAPRIMSESRVCNRFSLNKENPAEVRSFAEFQLLTSGVVNSVRLSSIVTISENVHFYATDTLMPLTIVPLIEEVRLKEAERIFLQADYKHRGSLENAIFKLKRRK
jgi:predicted RNA methylase